MPQYILVRSSEPDRQTVRQTDWAIFAYAVSAWQIS